VTGSDASRRAPRRGPGALALFPGAGSSSTHPTLLALDEGLAPLPVHRLDFPYRKEGRRAPDRAPKLVATVVEEATAIASGHRINPRRVVLGGRSMGGRMCSMAVAEGLPAAGLVLLSYPLHPPGKPETLRVDHFGALDLPCLFLAGTRDPFGSPDEVVEHVAAIPGPVTLRWIDGGRHDVEGHDDEIVAIVAEWLSSLGSGSPGPGSADRDRRG
jgi:predicted alpha/beta-hydrolase family hydrolase